MAIYVYPADTQGCGFYRLILAANVLAAQGMDVRVVPPRKRNGIRAFNDEAGQVEDVTIPADADVMVFQRVTLASIVDSFGVMRRRGIAVVVDMDDDLDNIDPRNPAFWALHKSQGGKHTTVTAARACQAATMVTVSTPALLPRYAPLGNGVVLPNMVPEGMFTIPRFDSTVVGWGGSVHSHPADLQVTGGAIGRLMREGHQFRVAGPVEGARDALGLPWEPDATGGVPINVWPSALSTLGVAIAPLADTTFNRAKSRLKVLEASALGVPTVFSPRADYMALHKLTGVGVPADKPKDWYRLLKRLVTEHSWRQEKSEQDRAAVAELTYERQAWLWAEVWLEAQRRQRKGSAVLRRTGQVKPQHAQV